MRTPLVGMDGAVPASDGMLIPLTDAFAPAVPLLSRCMMTALENCTDLSSLKH